ncbi:MAG TPA: DNA polymerase Y family protein [Xanthomonadaceae bacterium]|jgi:protein ImuB
MTTLWACFALPELSLESQETGKADAHAGDCTNKGIIRPLPCATHDAAVQRPRIVCANAPARAAGVRADMALVHAQSLLPGLAVRRHDATAQARRLELLGALAYGFSSQVVLASPDAVLLEIGASRALFGDWRAIEAALRTRLAEFGHRATLAAAPTPAAARVLADLADGYAVARPEHLDRVLARVPIGAARLCAEHTEELRRVGVRNLGDAFALPRAALARRFGAGLLQAFDRLRGLEHEPCVRYRPADRFERRIEFDYGIAQQDALRFPLQRLTRELAAYLQARDGGVPRFTLRFDHDPHERAAIAREAMVQWQEARAATSCPGKAGMPAGKTAMGRDTPSRDDPSTDDATSQAPTTAMDLSTTSLAVGLRKPCRDAGTLFEAACLALDRIALPAPAHALALVADDLPPFAPELRDLFDPGLRGQLDWDALAERLRSRLGAGAVRELALHADHRPERSWRIAEPAMAAAKEVPPKDGGVVPPRPLWLLPRPVPFRGRIVRFVESPERIETGWWDGEDMRRDYAIADLDTGQRAWLFRIVDAQAEPHDAPGWMLHGWFA